MQELQLFVSTHATHFDKNGYITPSAPTDVKTDFYNLQIKEKGIALAEKLGTQKYKHMHTCLNDSCGHRFSETPKEFKRNTRGCPACNKAEKTNKSESPKEKPKNAIEVRNTIIIEYFEKHYPVKPENIISALGLTIKANTVRGILKKATDAGLTPNAEHIKKQELYAQELATKINLSSEGNPYVVIDTETTGLSNFDEVLEITVLSSTGEILLNTLVKPTCKITKGASSVHHITSWKLRSAPSWQVISKQFAQVTEGKWCVAYNASFDRRLITQSLSAVGEAMPPRHWVCAMESYSHIHRLKRWVKLTEAVHRYGFKVKVAHRSLPDAEMALSVFKHIDGKKTGDVKRAPKRKKQKDFSSSPIYWVLEKVLLMLLSIPVIIGSVIFGMASAILPKGFPPLLVILLLILFFRN